MPEDRFSIFHIKRDATSNDAGFAGRLRRRGRLRCPRQPPETHHVRRVHGKEQRGHVMRKMQAGSVADLVRFASRLGIPPPGVPDPTKV